MPESMRDFKKVAQHLNQSVIFAQVTVLAQIILSTGRIATKAKRIETTACSRGHINQASC